MQEKETTWCYVNVPRIWNMLYELLIYETHSFTIIVVYRKKQKRHFIHETRSFEEKSCLLLYAKVQGTAAEWQFCCYEKYFISLNGHGQMLNKLKFSLN